MATRVCNDVSVVTLEIDPREAAKTLDVADCMPWTRVLQIDMLAIPA